MPFFIPLVTFLLFFAGCTTGGTIAQDSPIRIELGEPFRLQMGESGRLGEDILRLTFEEVTEDSRCPIGVDCVWEGEAVVSVRVITENADETVDLTLRAGTEHPPARIGNWNISIVDLLPYPAVDQEPETYTAEFVVVGP